MYIYGEKHKPFNADVTHRQWISWDKPAMTIYMDVFKKRAML